MPAFAAGELPWDFARERVDVFEADAPSIRCADTGLGRHQTRNDVFRAVARIERATRPMMHRSNELVAVDEQVDTDDRGRTGRDEDDCAPRHP